METELKEEKKQEECPECLLVAGTYVAIELCKELKDTDLNCSEELTKIQQGESPITLINKMKQIASKKQNDTLKENLDLLEHMLQGKK